MNRILLAVLTIFLSSSLAICQEPELLSPPASENSQSPAADTTLSPPSGPENSILPSQDTTLTQPQADTSRFSEIPEYVPLWESDTVQQTIGRDTINQFRTAPRVRGDTAVVQPDFSQSPSRAIMLALVLPGLGQAYNKKYFKVPIVWAAMGGAGYAIYYNSGQYQIAAREYAADPDNVDERILQYWRRNMELSYIAMIAVYALQVVDAYVDAQLFSWDVNDNLSMGVSPSLQPLMVPGSKTGYTYGLSCSFNLRRR